MQAGVLPSGEAVCSVPNTLVALCLNNAGMERVRQTKALSCFVPIFTSKAYIKALQGDTPPALGAGLDELLRHVGTLRKEGVEMIVDILKQLCEMGGVCCPSASMKQKHAAPAYPIIVLKSLEKCSGLQSNSKIWQPVHHQRRTHSVGLSQICASLTSTKKLVFMMFVLCQDCRAALCQSWAHA